MVRNGRPKRYAATFRVGRNYVASKELADKILDPFGGHHVAADAISLLGPRESDERPAPQPLHRTVDGDWSKTSATEGYPVRVGTLVHSRCCRDREHRPKDNPRFRRLPARTVSSSVCSARRPRPRGSRSEVAGATACEAWGTGAGRPRPGGGSSPLATARGCSSRSTEH